MLECWNDKNVNKGNKYFVSYRLDWLLCDTEEVIVSFDIDLDC